MTMEGRVGERVLVLWQKLDGESDGALKAAIERLKADVGGRGSVALENAERLAMGGHSSSTFDAVFSCCLWPFAIDHSLELMAEVARLAKPGARVRVTQLVRPSGAADDGTLVATEKLHSTLKLAGLRDVTAGEPACSAAEARRAATEAWGVAEAEADVVAVTVTAATPGFELGSSRLLSFAAASLKSDVKPSAATNNVWALDNVDDDDVDLLDQDQFLDDEDLKKPDPKSLRVCGSTGKRKACKDCSCGLTEELQAGKEPTKKSFTSSCGSCYLGDAFRCASCPYLGMPGFKPGDKIQLSERQLNADK